ncbi:MAG: flagellar basal body L-ring protein FlgH [Phycisphaeraceae bacterium]|nr:flagellar basal body L-ring protein FlgH [Phycisphaeraceae bacterium]
MKTKLIGLVVLTVAVSGSIRAQSSSLYLPASSPPTVTPLPFPAEAARVQGPQTVQLSPAIAQASFTALQTPEPRLFALHELITIIVRESAQAESSSKLDTSKDVSFDGQIAELPNLSLSKLLQLEFAQQIKSADGSPKLKLDFKNEFNGEGDYSRKDNMTARITAEVVDIKPNGNLVLEARKFIQSDKETLEIIVTGVCRPQDVAADNTLLSTQLANLDIRKAHTGELRKAGKKGWLTKLFEGVFNF